MEFLADLHPIVVHFPIAILTLYVFIEIFGISMNKEFLMKMAHLLLFIGIVTAIGAVLTGNQAAEVADQVNKSNLNYPNEIIEDHETYASITLWLFAGLLVLRTYLVLKKKFIGILRYIFIPLTIIGLYFIYETGNYGGKLVFDYGVGTELFKNTESSTDSLKQINK
ncbi:MAG: DUF2231 domain-containing protein [Melioribacteraceae bacterium]|nr:DUF2231 domain-containing protein [Melioribacteraceae bacterium]